MKEIHAVGVRIPSFLQKGVQDLILALKQWTGKKTDYVKLHVQEANRLLIPAGWIRALLTPRDSLVFGENFLLSYNIPLQQKNLQTWEKLEDSIKVSIVSVPAVSEYVY